MFRSTELKIKAMSLAHEAKLIRKEEQKAKERGDRDLNQSLHEHRILAVRRAARSTHLARGFLGGLSYKRIEAKCEIKPNVAEIRRLLKEYGTPEHRSMTKDDIDRPLEDWLDKE